MAKSVKTLRKEVAPGKETVGKSIIPPKYQTPLILLAILFVFLVYYAPMYFNGETYQSGDIITSQSARSYLNNEHEDFTLWYPYIFCGMPGYALTVDFKWFNLIYVGLTAVKTAFVSVLSTDYAAWTFYLLILAFTSYFLVLYLTDHKLIALFGSLTTAFSTGLVLFLMAGHVTKLTALCFFPLILLMLLKFENRIRLRDIALLTITLQLSLQGWHVQIIFYMLLSIGVYYLYNIVRSLLEKQMGALKQYFKSGFVFAGAMLVALLIQADNFTQIWEYNEYSTRGTRSIVELTNPQEKQSDSDFYQYATNYSWSPEELSTLIIPSFYGFGKSTYDGPLTRNQPVPVNTYFGQMAYVEVPMYMGVIVLFLALLGIYTNRKNKFVQYLSILAAFSFLVSFGRNFPPVYDLMFYYFPFFDKFRGPSMILIITQLTFPILAAYGVKSILGLAKNDDDKLLKIILYTAISVSAVLVFSFIASSGLKDWFAGRVNEYAASNPRMAQQFRALSDYLSEMFISDLQFSFGILSIVFWAAFISVKKIVPQSVFIAALVLLSLIDLVRVNKRAEEYQPEQNSGAIFVEPEYIKVIKSKNDSEPFRILNLKQDGSLGSFNANSNFNAHFLVQDLYGYSAIKPRSYQDYMDVVGPFNETLWRMLNVKYLIFDQQVPLPSLRLISQQEKTFVYENTNALPRAYFVDSVKVAKPIDLLNMVKENTFDPKTTAYVNVNSISLDSPDSTCTAKIIRYLDEKIEIETKASGNNLLFIGDTYYPKGWKAYIDGAETEIIKVNHGFRGIIVPAGNHKIVMKYLPASFVISKYLALALSSVILALFMLSFVVSSKKRGHD